MSTLLNLTTAELTDLTHLLSFAADLKREQLNDIGKDEPFADPKERDEIRDYLQREVAVAHKVLALVHSAEGAHYQTHSAQGADGDRCIGCEAFVPAESGAWGEYGPLCYSCMVDAHPCDGCKELWPQSQSLGDLRPDGSHDYLCENCYGVHLAKGAQLGECDACGSKVPADTLGTVEQSRRPGEWLCLDCRGEGGEE